MPRPAPGPSRLLCRVSAPNRVDVAGGTLDIYPLYLFIPGATTVNAAIAVRSVAEVRSLAPRREGKSRARIVSEDFRLAEEAADTHGFDARGNLGLIVSALRHYPPMAGVEIRVRNEAPLGSGIGASSALLAATMLALDAVTGRRRAWAETASAAMEIEAAHLRTMTGRQDYIAALRGGIQALEFSAARVVARRLPADGPVGRGLERHAVLASTGKSHHSGKVNWRMIRGAVEGDAAVLRKFRAIAGAAREAWEALVHGRIPEAGEAVSREWAVRKTLARGVTTRPVEEALSSRALRGTLAGAKLCGAGGGGVLFALLRSPEDRAEAEGALRSRGFALLPFRLSAGPVVERGPDVR